jgi:HEPN domain-containing protein
LAPEHREVAEFMLKRARQNLAAAETLVATEGQAENIVGFHLQQTIEKALKSVLAVREIEIPRTHALGDLADLAADSGVEVPKELASAGWLTPWAVDFRYEDEVSDLDIEAALGAATAAIGLAEQTLDEDEAKS